jgi:hypothetical protein
MPSDNGARTSCPDEQAQLAEHGREDKYEETFKAEQRAGRAGHGGGSGGGIHGKFLSANTGAQARSARHAKSGGRDADAPSFAIALRKCGQLLLGEMTPQALPALEIIVLQLVKRCR